MATRIVRPWISGADVLLHNYCDYTANQSSIGTDKELLAFSSGKAEGFVHPGPCSEACRLPSAECCVVSAALRSKMWP